MLVATSLGALAVALALALTPAGAFVGFVALPLPILAAIAGVSIAYLVAAELLKRLAMRPRAGPRRRNRPVRQGTRTAAP